MIGPGQNANNNFQKKRRKQLILIVQNHFQIWNLSKHAISTCLTEVDGTKLAKCQAVWNFQIFSSENRIPLAPELVFRVFKMFLGRKFLFFNDEQSKLKSFKVFESLSKVRPVTCCHSKIFVKSRPVRHVTISIFNAVLTQHYCV